ncbi:hypothetical protein [Hymenobacter sp. PAMC 26628]|uniref:hypothetical protein n=1 Tax=Hymenobacter sp. PAMC 26628 TaxID=1484118 RepID=UPI00077049B0|nr:hypothetical protein [Hymenobacter sp. PAMC 26628]AMJ64369.1 hypothetical protein AXW84_02205 [Hymenobacter sp. PAMC 26628]
MLLLRTLAALIALMTSCQAREAAPAAAKLGPPAVAPQPVVDTSRVAVLPYDEKRDQYIFQNAGQVKAASLSPAELAQVETLLRASIDEYNRPQAVELQKLRKAQPQSEFKADDFIINLPKYKRQLVAVLNAKGEKEVWVNCFSHEVYKMD